MRSIVTLGFAVIISISAMDPDPPFDMIEDTFPEWRLICDMLEELEQLDPNFRASLLQILSTRTPSGHSPPYQCEARPSSATPSPEVVHAHDLWNLMKKLVASLTNSKYELEILQHRAAVASALERTVLEAGHCEAGPSTSNDREELQQQTSERIEFLTTSIEKMQETFQDVFIQLISYKTYPVAEPAGEEPNTVPPIVTDPPNRPTDEDVIRNLRATTEELTHQNTVIQQIIQLVYENLEVLTAALT